MGEDIQNYTPTLVFRGTHCIMEKNIRIHLIPLHMVYK